MLELRRLSVIAAVLASSHVGLAHAHFKLTAPASWVVEDSQGNPQKSAPCGPGATDSPMMSDKITTFHAGETIMVEWTDTVAHPGHYRIALAQNRADFKDPDIKQDSFCAYDESIMPTLKPTGNVLADGVAFRSATGFNASAGMKFTQAVTLPSTPCEKCTLQVMQIMENDVQAISNCYYHHCADIKILPADGTSGTAGSSAPAGGSGGASAAGTSASAGAAGAAGTGAAGTAAAVGGRGGATAAAAGTGASSAGTGAAGAGTGARPASAGTSATGSVSNPVTTPPASTPTTATAGTAATSPAAPVATPAASSGGCSVAAVRGGTEAPWLGLGLALGLGILLRRQRRSGHARG